MRPNNHLNLVAGNHIHHMYGMIPQLILLLPFMLALVIYLVAVVFTRSHHKKWPFYRSALWIIGVSCSIVAVFGPVANHAHINFTFHMLSHLLLGMLAPLLMVMAAPMTLILRSLQVFPARRLSKIFRMGAFRLIRDPIVTSLLNVGGLWILYTSNLYMTMQQNTLLHVVVHLHVFLAGYLFTASFIYIDPSPHRTSFIYRAVVLVFSLAGHSILSKFIYANSVNGVPASQAETGSMLMYYGGDFIDLVLILIFCFQWFKATRPPAIIDNRPFHS